MLSVDCVLSQITEDFVRTMTVVRKLYSNLIKFVNCIRNILSFEKRSLNKKNGANNYSEP